MVKLKRRTGEEEKKEKNICRCKGKKGRGRKRRQKHTDAELQATLLLCFSASPGGNAQPLLVFSALTEGRLVLCVSTNLDGYFEKPKYFVGAGLN